MGSQGEFDRLLLLLHGRSTRAISTKPQVSRRKHDPLLDHAHAGVDRVYDVLAVIAYLLLEDDRHDLDVDFAGARSCCDRGPRSVSLTA